MAADDTSKPQGWSGKTYLSIDDLAVLQPGLARLMPEIGQRYWKLYYAARSGNWVLANFQMGEIGTLMETGIITRPKYTEHLEAFIKDDLGAIGAAIKAKDWAAFETAFVQGVQNANDYHKVYDKDYLVWKLPDYPPPDLDMTPLES